MHIDPQFLCPIDVIFKIVLLVGGIWKKTLLFKCSSNKEKIFFIEIN